MFVKVKYFGHLGVALEKKEEDVEVSSEATISELLGRLADTYGESFKEEVYEPRHKKVKEGFIATVNGIALGQLDGIRTKLKDGDYVTLFPLLAGGG